MNPDDVIAGRYRLLRPIGRGAMGTVWAARHELLGRDFALKFARVRAQEDSAARARFQTEAQLLGKLRHPNIVDVTDFGEVSPDGDFFLAMELLEGESLADRIARHGHLESYESVAIAADVARGLAAVHAVGIVHRDVKPENIFLARSPTGIVVPKLLDFGISKDRSEGAAAQQRGLTGTPAYMSPEQANGETKLDPRTDIWSLGVVLYEMLTGKHPFVEPNYQALMTAIAEKTYRALDKTIPVNVCRIVDRCLAKRPDDRFSNCNDLATALAANVDRAASSSGFSAKHARRGAVLLGAVLAALMIGASVFWLAGSSPTSQGEPVATTSTTVMASFPQSSATARGVLTDASANVNALPSSSSALTTTVPTPSAARTNVRRSEKRVSTSVTNPGF